jgi:hypothetical protein
MSPRGEAVSNTRYLSSSEKRVNADIRVWKLHLSESNWCQESFVGIWFTNQWKATSLQPLTFSNHCSLFKCISWLNGSFFGGWTAGFSERGVKTFRMAPMSPLKLANFFFFCLHIYNLCSDLPESDTYETVQSFNSKNPTVQSTIL